ncbi:efflux RND transporter periplasmic adaptor subunit [Sphaerisporangium fuscum]|uniref:efflux RND transporter periplasmic adaptor subunit n=1 Tax=Sphaerisporangium fuscum TaxID=2835868 RepID=UPI0027E2E79E|nr:peptidoglycan-binding protein [Sphaerisporangium fuscum]
MKRGPVVAGVLAAVLVAGAAAAAVTFGGSPRTAAASPTLPPTADVVRGDLVDTVAVDGTLTFSGDRKILAGASGTVTSVARIGSVIKQGGTLFTVDRRPTVLLRGRLPLYRTLRQGVSDGPDVMQLESAMKALGYGREMTVDRHFSWATRQAVRRWQKHRGMKQTGEVDVTQVVFLPGDVRVTDTKISVGDRTAPGGQAMTVSSTRQVVHVDLDVDKQDLVRRGARVSVELPEGRKAKGRITYIGAVVKRDNPKDAGQSGTSTVEVEIELSGGKKARGQDQAPVTVTLVSERRRNVLSVPIEALLALRDGGFGVEILQPDGRRRTVSVKTGVYGGGRVQITGPGLQAGTKVTVPAA